MYAATSGVWPLAQAHWKFSVAWSKRSKRQYAGFHSGHGHHSRGCSSWPWSRSCRSQGRYCAGPGTKRLNESVVATLRGRKVHALNSSGLTRPMLKSAGRL